MAGKRRYDWAAIERDYRTGQFSNRALAKRHGCSEAAIRKRVDEDGWSKDLAKPVRSGIKRALETDEVRSTHSAHNAEDDAIVEEAVQRGITVVREHRNDIKKARSLVDLLVGELTEETKDAAKLLEALEKADKETFTTSEVKRLRHALSLPARSTSARQLAGALKDLTTVERTAFGLDAGKGEDPKDHLPLEERLKAYKRDEDIDASENVTRLGAKSG